MAFEGQTRISLRHTASVVDDLYRGSSRINNQDTYSLCTGIHSVLDQLLDDRSRSLDDFTSSNLVSHGIW